MRFNINKFAIVQLTKSGAEMINNNNRTMLAKLKSIVKHPEGLEEYYKHNYKEGDMLREQFWYIMAIFAPMLSVGSEVPFKDAMITVEEDES